MNSVDLPLFHQNIFFLLLSQPILSKPDLCFVVCLFVVCLFVCCLFSVVSWKPEYGFLVLQAFVFISLLNSLRFTLGIMPYSMKALAEGRHACDRMKVE